MEIARDAMQAESTDRALGFRRRRGRKTVNRDLSTLPDDRAFLQAVADAVVEHRYEIGATATTIAWRLGVEGAHRAGRGAIAHSWTGTMAPALRVSPRLRSLAKRGLLDEFRAPGEHRLRYELSRKGREMLNSPAEEATR
jgi:hypothetical protein